MRPLAAASLLALSVVLTPAAAGQTQVVSYRFEGVQLQDTEWTSGVGTLTGAFDWTFEVGDFENGSGQLTELDVPWSTYGLDDIEITAEPDQLELVMPLNLHDHGMDITLKLQQPLTPTSGALIDTSLSHFQIEVGIIHAGPVIAGSVAPEPGTTEWLDLGGALAGTDGPALLLGSGEMVAGETVTLLLSNAAAGAPAGVVVGLDQLDAPFKGGVMVPDPLLILTGLTTNGAGGLALSAPWPAGLPADLTSLYQIWIADGDTPAGWAASNAVAGTTP